MKKLLLYMTWAALGLLYAGCDDDDKAPRLVPEETGTVTDNDGNEYGWVRYAGLDWMTSNFKGGTPYYELKGGWWGELININDREQAIADYDLFGNLYSWEDAKSLAPEGWRLPTDEDWQKLEQALGMSASEAAQKGWRGDGLGLVIQADPSEGGIALKCGGYASNSAGHYNELYLRQVRDFGYYWTSTIDESYTTSTAVWYRRIGILPQIERQVITTQEVAENLSSKDNRYLSVRYVRDAQ